MADSIFEKIRGGLKKTRDNISSKVGGVLASFKKIDEDFYDELEETLILCDIGVGAAGSIMETLKKRVKEQKITETPAVKELLTQIITDMMSGGAGDMELPGALLIVGVNGVGKTTAIGKLAHHYISQGKSVVLAAADTFRAAAAEQLTEWGKPRGREGGPVRRRRRPGGGRLRRGGFGGASRH